MADTLPVRALSRSEVRSVDQTAIEKYRIPGVVLMENAGAGAARLLCEIGDPQDVCIVAGSGNNGGDGFVIARHLDNRGVPVRVVVVGECARIRGDAAVNLEIIRCSGLPVVEVSEADACADALEGADWIVDALLGTGTQGELRAPYGPVIRAINESSARVLSVDLPSGLDCDTGQPLEECVRAHVTATFVAPKIGFERPSAAALLGDLHVIDIGAPRPVLDPFRPQ